MNIFVLSESPIEAAQMQCNKHVVKMVTETAQILCSIFPDGQAPYKRTHYNHPCCKWARYSRENYQWLLQHGDALAEEYALRYDRLHAAFQGVLWCKEHFHQLNCWPTEGLTPHPQCMPDEYKRPSVVEAYREYYVKAKAHFAKWPEGRMPAWWAERFCLTFPTS
jgi:hypothetical protein